jgi:hypothetical protein
VCVWGGEEELSNFSPTFHFLLRYTAPGSELTQKKKQACVLPGCVDQILNVCHMVSVPKHKNAMSQEIGVVYGGSRADAVSMSQ